MNYGALSVPAIGKEITLTAGSRAMSFLGYYEVGQRASSFSLTVPNKTAGSTLHLVPIQFGAMVEGGPISSSLIVDGIQINDNVVTFHINDSYGMTVKVAVFEILGAAGTGETYGVMLADSSNYMELNSNNAGCCVWRGTVNINGKWDVPYDIPARENAVVFVNWSDPDAALMFDNNLKQIRCYSSYGDWANIYANVVVFTSGFNLDVPMYGDAIYNAAGQCTYSSMYSPLILAGGVGLNTKPNVWTACPVAAPLVPVGSVGAMRTGKGGKDHYTWSRCGVKMYQGNVAGGPAERMGAYQETGMSASMVSPVSFPVLDASVYF